MDYNYILPLYCDINNHVQDVIFQFCIWRMYLNSGCSVVGRGGGGALYILPLYCDINNHVQDVIVLLSPVLVLLEVQSAFTELVLVLKVGFIKSMHKILLTSVWTLLFQEKIKISFAMLLHLEMIILLGLEWSQQPMWTSWLRIPYWC